MCHHTVSPALCYLCKDTHEGWDAQGEAEVGFPYQYVENIDGGATIYLDFFENDDTPIMTRHPYTCGMCNWGRDGAYHDYNEYESHMAKIHNISPSWPFERGKDDYYR